MTRGLCAQLLRHLAGRYQAGATLDELAPLVGCSPPTLAARFRELGDTIRPPGRRRYLGNNAGAITRRAAQGSGRPTSRQGSASAVRRGLAQEEEP